MSEPLPLRRLSDAETLRALAHPVRIALAEALYVHGPLTATEAGERIGETPTTCSFHLRQLARYGFVEEAGGGKGRARPWKISSIGLSIVATHEDPETQVASRVLTRMLRERQLARFRQWEETRADYPKEWQEGALSDEYLLYMTAEEMAALGRELLAMLLPRVQEQRADPSKRPAGALPVELLFLGYPIEPPAADR
ncbi:MAG TPA: helix-turn-helix domain-containing protein [Acidimicrobiales bacterium]|nr:helix-turn-helix domain-containing protein [Acidimicrobiales bacterium]